MRSVSSDFLLRMSDDEHAALLQRAAAAHLSIEAYVRRQCGIDADNRMKAFAAAAHGAGERFDAAFADLDERLAGRPRVHAIGLAAGAD